MAISKQTLDAVTKRITGRTYTDPNELAREMAYGLAALSRQPSFVRGLSRDTIADIQGGTTLGVGDNSAANLSDVLVQNPQPGIPRDIGSGLRTRRQARIESKVRTVPCIVTANASAGSSTVQVKIVANGVTKSQDAATGIQTVGDPLSDLGEEVTASTSGSPFVTPGDAGIQPPVIGQTLYIELAEQWESTTSWTKRFRKNHPVVVKVLKSRSFVITNGLINVVS
jgi:hypothetical protein